MTVYGARCNVHPDRTGVVRTPPYRLLVVHTSEGSEGATSAENLCSFMTLPGDRVDPSDGSRYGASYHYVTDTDRVIPATPDNVVAYAAAGANNDGIHICIPGKAAQTRDQWLDAITSGYVVQLADVMRDKAREYKIPLRRLTVADIIAGKAGYCGHYDISRAYHRSDHTDPGAAFPWDVLAADLEDDMPLKLFNVKPSALNAGPLFASGDGIMAAWLSGEQWAALGNPPATELLERVACRRYTLVGDCPDGYRGIWGQDTLG